MDSDELSVLIIEADLRGLTLAQCRRKRSVPSECSSEMLIRCFADKAGLFHSIGITSIAKDHSLANSALIQCPVRPVVDAKYFAEALDILHNTGVEAEFSYFDALSRHE